MRGRKKGDDTRVSSPSGVVEVVPTEAVRLIEILPSSQMWDGRKPAAVTGFEGAIVKAQPPDGATDEQVETAREVLKKAGALHVRILPRKRARKEVPEKAKLEALKAHRDLRKAVMVVLESSTHPNRDAVKKELEAVLGAEGL